MDKIFNNSILIVDDESDIVELVKMEAKRVFSNVFSTTSPISAIDICRKEKIDVVVSDLVMPEMDGITLISNLKKINDNTSFLILSGSVTKEVIQDAFRLGSFDFIDKPFTRVHLKLAMLRGIEKFMHNSMSNHILKLLIESNSVDGSKIKELSDPYSRLEEISKAFVNIKSKIQATDSDI